MKIGNFEINKGKTFIIAELSANHNQDFDLAVKTIKAAKEAGADAIKLQTYKPDSLTIDADTKYFAPKTQGIWKGYTPYKLYEEAYTPWEWQPKLKKIAEEEGLICFSSPFDFEGVDFLDAMDVPAYKIASFEITDIPLIKYTASKMKPMIISTGIATLADIEAAVNACRQVGNNNIAILKCTSSYPAPYDEINLKTIPEIPKIFNTLVGLSDHTMGFTVPIAAVSLGASIVEKHFILDRSLGGPDSSFSMEPDEFKQMVDSIRITEKALGSINFNLTENTIKSRNSRRSLFVVKDIKKDEILSKYNIRSIRPGNGIEPKHYEDILGKRAIKDVKKGYPLDWGMFE
ncbi:MAG: pseudaminic acid synthase [Campylobacterales bacterium]|nr:pseudaminic acid synthase [Campylobacterales bacterium]